MRVVWCRCCPLCWGDAVSYIDEASGALVLPPMKASDTSPYASASAAYDSWAASLGVSSTATISAFDSDDGIAVLDLGFPPLIGGMENRIVVSGESGISLFRAPIINTASANLTINVGVTISRMQGATTPPPSLLFAIRPLSQDAGVGSSKWQKSGKEAILFYRTGPYGSRNKTDVAVRFRPGRCEIVTTIVTQESQKLVLARFNQNSNNTAVGAVTLASALANTQHFETLPPWVISGVVKDDSGVPVQRTVRSYRRDTGQFDGETQSDATTGTYTLEVFGEVERQVVCLDDDAGTAHNDLLLRVLPP